MFGLPSRAQRFQVRLKAVTTLGFAKNWLDDRLGGPRILSCPTCSTAGSYQMIAGYRLRVDSVVVLTQRGEHGNEQDEIEASMVVRSLTVLCRDIVRHWRIFARSMDSINILRFVPFHRTVTGMPEPSLSFQRSAASACPQCGFEQERCLERCRCG